MFDNLPRNQRKDLNEALDRAQRRAQAPWSPSGWSNPLSNVVNRRAFLRGGAGLIGGAMLSKTLGGVSVASAATDQCSAVGSSLSPWGAIGPRLDRETGLNLLQLPTGFSYRSFGWTGDIMDDSLATATPPLHDGMAVIQEIGRGHLLLVRNHEVDYARKTRRICPRSATRPLHTTRSPAEGLRISSSILPSGSSRRRYRALVGIFAIAPAA